MTRNELSLAVGLAQSNESLATFLGENSSQRLIDLFTGFLMADYEAVHITIRDLAALVRYECTQLNGELCNQALEQIAVVGKTKFIVLGIGDDNVPLEALPDWYRVVAGWTL